MIPGEQRQVVLLDGGSLEDFNKLNYLSLVFVVNIAVYKGQGLEAVVHSILLYGCETWPVRIADERILEVFVNDSICRILRVRHRDCVPSVELRRRLCLTSIPTLLV